jgi:hypothetical protein
MNDETPPRWGLIAALVAIALTLAMQLTLRSQTMEPDDKQKYIDEVREALHSDTSRELTSTEYIEALEEIAADVDGHLEAAREEAGE